MKDNKSARVHLQKSRSIAISAQREGGLTISIAISIVVQVVPELISNTSLGVGDGPDGVGHLLETIEEARLSFTLQSKLVTATNRVPVTEVVVVTVVVTSIVVAAVVVLHALISFHVGSERLKFFTHAIAVQIAQELVIVSSSRVGDRPDYVAELWCGCREHRCGESTERDGDEAGGTHIGNTGYGRAGKAIRRTTSEMGWNKTLKAG